MDNFYDINDFFAFLVRKWKSFLILIILFSVGFAGTRGIRLLNEYKNQENGVNIEEQKKEDEPTWTKVLVNIQITPEYKNIDGELVEDTQRYIEGYRKLGTNEVILNEMYDKWYGKEAEEAQNRKRKLHDYGYILDKELKYPYEKVDFWGQFLLDGVELNSIVRTVGADNSTEHIITMGFKSSNEELAKAIANDYAERLTNLVEKEIGTFEYTLLGNTVLYELPSASAGTQTTRYINNVSSNSNITMRYVLIQTIKGVIWGGMIGFFASVIILFFVYMMTRRVYIVSDLKKYNLPILGLGFASKKRLKKFWSNVYCLLEGYKWDTMGMEQNINKMNRFFIDTDKVIVVGTEVCPEINEFVKELNNNSKTGKYIFLEDIAETESLLKQEDNIKVLFVEKMGKSLKYEIEQNISFCNVKNIPISGIVGIE